MNIFDKFVYSTVNANKFKRYLQTRIKKTNSLYEYINHPFVDLDKSVLDCDYLALDFETTGLDAKKDTIVSIGYVAIKSAKIILKESSHYIIYQPKTITTDSVKIHQITDQQLQNGIKLIDGIKKLLTAMKGKIILAHYHKIEKSFLNTASISLFGYPVPCYFVDTMQIESRKNAYYPGLNPLPKSSLRLHQLKNTYNLPKYNAHNALEDAIGTAELFLAQINRNYKNTNKIKVKDIICR